MLIPSVLLGSSYGGFGGRMGTNISELENGNKSPTVDVLFRLSDALNVKPSRLLAAVERRRERAGNGG